VSINEFCGNTRSRLDRVKQVVKLGGFVQALSTFFDIPAVIDVASSLTVEVFGQAGRRARVAVGVYRLPRHFPVEIGAVLEIAD
jgi:enamine deaminase RidA (YjgF/YER057c/UK114 family)